MNILLSLLLVVQVLSAIGVIVLVLLQHGKGADMGAAFGSGASGSLFGATGSANFLSRVTAGLATLFFVCTLTLALLVNKSSAPPKSVMEQPAASGAASSIPGASAPVAPAAGSAASVPGAAPSSSGSAPSAPSAASSAPAAAPSAPAAAPSAPGAAPGSAAAPKAGDAPAQKAGGAGEIPK
jgi:preprotein translocase subunit SecG